MTRVTAFLPLLNKWRLKIPTRYVVEISNRTGDSRMSLPLSSECDDDHVYFARLSSFHFETRDDNGRHMGAPVETGIACVIVRPFYDDFISFYFFILISI